MSQKYVRDVTKFILIVLRIQKNKCNFHYVAMPMMTPQIFKSVNFTKTQKSRYFTNKTFFLQKKTTTLIAHQGPLYAKKCFAADVIFSRRPQNQKKNCWGKIAPPQANASPKNVTSLPMRAKIVISPKAAEKCYPSIQNVRWGEGERTLSTLSLSYKAVYRGVVLVIVD